MILWSKEESFGTKLYRAPRVEIYLKKGVVPNLLRYGIGVVGENLAQGAHENLLEKIFSIWEQDPSQAFTITQLASRLQMNRRELKVALEVLYELVFFETTTWRKTRKEGN